MNNKGVAVSFDDEGVRQWCAIMIDFGLEKDRLLSDTKRLVDVGYRGDCLNQLLVAAYSAEESGLATASTMIDQFVRVA